MGVSVPGFTNMFLIYGPNTNTASESVIYFHEQQAAYVVQAAEHLAAGGRPLRVRPDVDRRYDEEVQHRLAGGVWTACTNWYRAPDGRVVTNWPGTYLEYRRRTRTLNLSDFEPGEARESLMAPDMRQAADQQVSQPISTARPRRRRLALRTARQAVR